MKNFKFISLLGLICTFSFLLASCVITDDYTPFGVYTGSNDISDFLTNTNVIPTTNTTTNTNTSTTYTLKIDYLNVIEIPNQNYMDMEYFNGYIYLLNSDDAYVKAYLAQDSFTIYSEINTGGSGMFYTNGDNETTSSGGVTYKDGEIWVASLSNNAMLYAVNGTPTPMYTLSRPESLVSSLHFDGKDFWVLSRDGKKLYQLDATGTEIKNISLDYAGITLGITSKDKEIYIANGSGSTATISALSKDDGKFLASATIPNVVGSVQGIAFDGANFWILECWATDGKSRVHKLGLTLTDPTGTIVQVRKIKEAIINGTYNMEFSNPFEFNNMVYFQGKDNYSFFKIFEYNGNEVLDVAEGSSGYNQGFYSPVVANNQLYFAGQHTSGDTMAFVYDGAALQSIGIETGSDYSNNFNYPVEFEGKVYFQGMAKDYYSMPYVIDSGNINNVGKASGTTYTNSFNSPYACDSGIYFYGMSDGGGWSIFQITGGEISDVDTNGSTYKNDMTNGISIGNRVYFQGYNGSKSTVFYLQDGVVHNLTDTENVSGFSSPVAIGSDVLFSGAITGPNMACRISGESISSVNYVTESMYTGDFNSPIVCDNKVFFEGTYSGSTPRLYYYDPADGYINIVPIAADSTYQSVFMNPVILDGKIYFSGNDSTDQKIFVFDGNEIRDVDPGMVSSYSNQFQMPTVAGDKIIFFGQNNNMESKIFQYSY